VTGRLRSKNAAAEWALERLPPEHRPVLARARDGYLRGDESWEDLRAQVLPFAHAVVAEIEAGRR
jgi:streptomycin 3"-adenylyltransferase